MGGTVAPEKILRELSDWWVSLGKKAPAEAEAGMLRACSMTLVVLAEESEDVDRLRETIAALMPAHPARVLMVRLRGAGERALSERVYAQCWMPFGQRRQICCEQIEITASDAALADLPPVVLPLAVPDFPVILWCRSARLWGMPEFRPIQAMAHKVVLDSAAFADPKAALPRMAEAVGRGVLLGDLSWTRLTRWREMLAQVFENRQHLALLPRVSRVRVEFGETFEALAWYMGAWVAGSLADAGVRAELSVTKGAGGASLRVTVSGEGIQVELARREDRLTIVVNSLSHCTNLPRPAEHLLLREELGIVRHDPVFERALASAARLAYPGEK
ncbi:MAG: glucose-6-phosphate dehydrogenase assembly protein OpcA [Acidobacteriia bacterium]|nr:glucose-6-phosphate dehydrogenase assembly protein OpcA [Terriglobia bacterium]